MTETQERPSRLAMEIAVHMEVHAALSTTTEAKAREIDSLLAADRLVIRQSDTRIEGGGERYPTADREYEDIDDPRKTGLADLMEPETPTPEHVEGDVLSVGEMEVVAWECTDLILGGEPSVITDIDHAAMRKLQPKAWTVEDLVRASSVQSRIQRAERERDEADQYKWQFLNSTIDRCRMDAAEATARAEKAEAQLADAVKVLKLYADPSGYSRGDGEPYEAGENHPGMAAATFLSTIGEKPDAE